MHMLRSMKIMAKTADVLTRLRANRETHVKIVVEARDGYMKRAREALESRLKQLESGKLVTLSFNLMPPQNQTAVYNVAIEMLGMHTGAEIELDSDQVRNLMRDEWDWSSSFLMSNSAYSATAAARLGADGTEDDIGAGIGGRL